MIIIYDIVLWVRVGFLHMMTGMYVVSHSWQYTCGSRVPNEKSTLYMLYWNYYYEIYTLWLSPESIRSSVLIERLILVALLAMGDRRMSGSVKVKTAMVDWKRGKELFEEDGKETLTPRVLVRLFIRPLPWQRGEMVRGFTGAYYSS